MPIASTNLLRIFILNVGQADTSVIVTPKGKVSLIDVANPRKVQRLVESLGLKQGDVINNIVITHPHTDHYSGAAAIVKKYKLQQAYFAPFKHCKGEPGYHALINKIYEQNVPLTFLSGHAMFRLDGFPNTEGPELELVGPTNNILEGLAATKEVTPNHLSLISKLTFGKFVMVSAGDAQMENWGSFDSENMMPQRCNVLKAAHHGSRHGTQCERLERLSPTYCVVSSDPDGRHKLPDLVGAATFCVHASTKRSALLTSDTGTVEIRVTAAGTCTAVHYSDGSRDFVDFGNEKPLAPDASLTDWDALVRTRLSELP